MTARTAVASGEPDEPTGQDLTLRDVAEAFLASPFGDIIKAANDVAMSAVMTLLSASLDGVFGRGPLADVARIVDALPARDVLDTPLPVLMEIIYNAVRDLPDGQEADRG